MAKQPSSKAKKTPEKDVSPGDESAEDISKPAEDSMASDLPIGEDTVTSTSEDTIVAAPEDTVGGTSEDTVDAAPEDTPEGTLASDASSDDPATDSTEADKDETGTVLGPDTEEGDTLAPDDSGAASDSAADEKLEAAPVSLPAPTPQPEKGPGVAPLVMGGIAAGAIGFAAAYFGLAQQPTPRDTGLVTEVETLATRVEEQSGTIDALTEKVGGIANTDDSALNAQIEALGTLSERVAETESAVDAIAAELGEINTRLSEVELRPVSENADAAAITAYENELNAAREEIAAQREELQALIDEAMSTENAADAAARASIQRAAVSRIQAALDSGAAFTGAIADLEQTGVEVPAALTSVADTGVATLSSLQESFPAAARAALDASRDVTSDGAGLTGFLRSQLGARSLEPREGDDPDAILSRVEAALRDARLQDALAETEALPEEGRAELSDWSGRVAQRLEAVGAARSLAETLN